MSKQFPTGFLIAGICKGAKTVTENGYTNDNLYIQIGERPNEIGEMVAMIETVSLFGDKKDEIMRKANESIDKQIVMSINRQPAKRDLRTAFMRNSINQRSEIYTLS